MTLRGPILVCVLGLTGLLLWLGAMAVDRWIDATLLPPLLAETSVEVRDRHGDLLRAYPVANGIWRFAVSPEDVDPDFLDMLVRYEDKRFYDHAGVDLRAMLRAAGQALWNGRTVSGGSTLTMQVARLLEDGSTGRWGGKLRQIRVALALERHLSKADILRLYLIHAPYGGNLEGVRAASLAWFGKEPRRLTAAQATLLVALPQSPEGRRPDRAFGAAQAARGRVGSRMADAGLLTDEQLEALQSAPLPDQMRAFPQVAPHMADSMATGAQGGQIDLTLDMDLQIALEHLVANAVQHQDAQLSAAVVVANHQTGEILASVGSPAYTSVRQGFVDMTTARRSPGSTLKPLIYGMAFDRGLAHPETLIHDGPVNFDGYAPQNFDGRFRGDVRLRAALQQSLNTPVVRLLDHLGPARLIEALRRGGASAQVPGGRPGLAVALGGIGISLRDLVEIYVGIAAGGQGPKLRYRLDAPRENNARMITPVSAWYLADILRDLPPPPGARHGGLAYKTGTSYGHRDAWAIGWDGVHVIGVWMGRADGTPVPGAFGGDLAAPLLFESFGLVAPDFAPFPAAPPAALTVSNAELPLPLRRFEDRFDTRASAEGVQLVFPPDGAQMMMLETLTLKLQGGRAPFTVLQDGRPVATRVHQREFEIPVLNAGFSELVVVDQLGHSDRVQIKLQ